MRSGDKVVLTVKEGENVLDLVSSMASKNVELEVRELKIDANRGIHDANSSATGSMNSSPNIGRLMGILEDKISMDPRQAFIEFLRINTTKANSASQVDDANERL